MQLVENYAHLCIEPYACYTPCYTLQLLGLPASSLPPRSSYRQTMYRQRDKQTDKQINRQTKCRGYTNSKMVTAVWKFADLRHRGI